MDMPSPHAGRCSNVGSGARLKRRRAKAGSDLRRAAGVVRRAECGGGTGDQRGRSQIPSGDSRGGKLRQCWQRRAAARVLAQQTVHIRAAQMDQFVLVEVRRLRQRRKQHRCNHGRNDLSPQPCRREITQGRKHRRDELEVGPCQISQRAVSTLSGSMARPRLGQHSSFHRQARTGVGTPQGLQRQGACVAAACRAASSLTTSSSCSFRLRSRTIR
jgi:hypothetical protein